VRVKTEEDYRATLREIESLMRAAPNSPDGERLGRRAPPLRGGDLSPVLRRSSGG
jgi:hypothetical protein